MVEIKIEGSGGAPVIEMALWKQLTPGCPESYSVIFAPPLRGFVICGAG